MTHMLVLNNQQGYGPWLSRAHGGAEHLSHNRGFIPSVHVAAIWPLDDHIFVFGGSVFKWAFG